jgi:hypothetical protein
MKNLNIKFIGKRLIGVATIILLFLGFVYLFTGGEDYWTTVGVSVFLIIFLLIGAGLILVFGKIIAWAFDL